MSTSVRSAIDDRAMSPFQVGAVGVCAVLNAVDGFDVLAIAFAAPLLAKEWALPQDQLGLLFSAGLAGMTAGSVFVAPLADKLGRRTVTLLSLVIVTFGMFGSALAGSVFAMAVARCLAGVGVGAMLPSINTIVAEYSSTGRRALSVSVMATGYPIGAMLGGMISVSLVAQFGWQGIFAFGGLLSLVMIPVVLWRLPESLGFLLAVRPANALERVNRLLRRMGRAPVSALPDEVVENQGRRPGLRDLVRGELLVQSALLWMAFFCVMASFYFVLQWTPKLLVDAGLNAKEGISGGILLNLGGVVGALILGGLTIRWSIFQVQIVASGLAALSIACFGLVSESLSGSLLLAPLVGVFLFAAMVGLYAISPAVYPSAVRNSGTGIAIGAGRGGAILSPWIAGRLLEGGMAPPQLFLCFGIPMAAASLAIAVLRKQGIRSASPALERTPG